jgi:hypothetical protein
MTSALQDLRFLHMAKNLEDMFEGLEKAFVRHLPEGAVKEALRPIFDEGDGHRRLRAAYDELNHRLSASPPAAPGQLLECILACEQAAQRFYLDAAGHMQDPALAALFRTLAKEEGHHIGSVQDALRLQRMVG